MVSSGSECEEGHATITRMIQPPATRAAIAEFSSRARACFGPRLVRLVVFGSQARGEATEDSDVDLLVVVDQLTSAEASSTPLSAISSPPWTCSSPLLLSAERFDELRARERVLIAEIDREGIPV
jgi:predicted nucleotidyltransferase